MSRTWAAAAIGIAAGVMLAAAYLTAPYAGLHIDGAQAIAFAAILAFAAAVAVFSLVLLSRPGGRTPYQKLRLDEMPASRSISLFRDPDKLQISARPEQSYGEILVRFGDTFKSPAEQMDKKIVLTLKGSKKAFNPVVLKQLFGTLAPFKLEHVLLLGERDEFVGYLPGERAKKDFSGADAETKIAKCVVAVFANPSDAAALRAMNGISRDDTAEETDDVRHAVRKIYANEAVQGLVIHKHLKPVGVISKVDLLTITSSEIFSAGLA